MVSRPNDSGPICLAVGDAYWDFCFAPVDTFPTLDEQIEFVPEWASRNPGGSLGYMSVALSSLGFSDFKIMANLGDDEYSVEWLRRIGAAGIDVSLMQISPNESIGAGVVFVTSAGDRFIIGSYGANTRALKLTPEVLDECDTLLITGFCQTPGLWNESIISSLRSFKSKPGKSVILDPNWNKDPRAKRFLLQILPFVDIFLPNRSEFRLIESNDIDIKSSAHKFLEKFHLTLVTKLGQDGCLVADSSGMKYFETQAVKVRDTTGAGDFFYAGFVASHVFDKRNVEEAAAFANDVASASIQHLTLESKLKAIRLINDGSIDPEKF